MPQKPNILKAARENSKRRRIMGIKKKAPDPDRPDNHPTPDAERYDGERTSPCLSYEGLTP
jgi:hypothetical protein